MTAFSASGFLSNVVMSRNITPGRGKSGTVRISALRSSLFPLGGIDIEILPIAREYAGTESQEPRLDIVALQPEIHGELRHVGARDAGHRARRRELLLLGRALEERFRRAIVVGVGELRDVDALRLLAVQLRVLVVARGRAAEAARVHLELAFLQVLDHVL